MSAAIPGDAVARNKQLFKDIAIMHFGAAYFVAPYQLVFHIRGDMVLVAEEALPVFLRPAGINIFLAAFVLIPVFGFFPFFYLLILVAAIALYRHSNNTGINDLSFLSPEPMIVQKALKAGKQRLNDTGLGQIFTKPPYGCTVRNLAGGMKTKKAGERVVVEDLKFQGFIRQSIQRLQDQCFEKQNCYQSLWPRNWIFFLFPVPDR